MRTQSIPHTDLKASILCLGTGDMGAGIDRQGSFRMLDEFLAGGGNFIDTASIYSDWIPGERSRSEKLIGAWMQARRNRTQVVLATKGAHPRLDSMHVGRLSPAEVAADLEASLNHLQTESIDLYWLHRDDPTRPVAEILETLHGLVLAGKLRYYACSNWKLERIMEAQAYAQEHAIPGFAAVQNLWNLAQLNPDGFADQTIAFMDESLWQYHEQTQLAAVPYSSQANGLFHKLEKASAESLPANLRSWYLNPVTLERFQKLQVLHQETGLTTTQIVLGYLTSQPFPTFPIVGPKSPEQLADCLEAGDVTLTPEQLQHLEGKR